MSAASQTGAPAVELRGLEKSFGEGDSRTRVLKCADFEARLGEMMFLVGPSGCGKTTLLSILTGTLHADGGEVLVLGHALHRLSAARVTAFRAAHVGFVFQQFNLIPTLTAEENTSVPLLIQGWPTRRATARARELLLRVGLGDKLRSFPAQLSGGQQQRVAIARALVHEPPLIVCDEPTSALDGDNGRQVMELLREVARDPQRCVIIVTHDHRTYRFGDRLSEMEDGRILAVRQTPEEIARVHLLPWAPTPSRSPP